MTKQKNEPASGGKINVSVDIKHERFGFIQSTDTIYFQHEAEKIPTSLCSSSRNGNP